MEDHCCCTGEYSSDEELKKSVCTDLKFEYKAINDFIGYYGHRPIIKVDQHDKYIDLVYSNSKIFDRGQVIPFDGFLNATLNEIKNEDQMCLIRVYNKGITTYLDPVSDNRPDLYKTAIQSLVKVFPECDYWINNRRSYVKWKNFGWKKNIKIRRYTSCSYAVISGSVEEVGELRKCYVPDFSKLHDIYLSYDYEGLYLHISVEE